MRMINGRRADELRKAFISAFVNTESGYYRTAICEMRLHSDGMCYIGSLRECFLHPESEALSETIERLSAFDKLLVMCDLNSNENAAPDNWTYPKRAVLMIDRRELEALLPALPDGAYLFDEGFTIAAALTRDKSGGTERCIVCKNE